MQSPSSNLNKSVSFNHSVKVREFPSNSNRRKSAKTGKIVSNQAMPQRRLEYDHDASPRADSYRSGASSARNYAYEPSNGYNIRGGSPLVSRRHGSTSNLHEPSPGRLNDRSSHHSSARNFHSGGMGRDASPRPVRHEVANQRQRCD